MKLKDFLGLEHCIELVGVTMTKRGLILGLPTFNNRTFTFTVIIKAGTKTGALLFRKWRWYNGLFWPFLSKTTQVVIWRF